MKPDAHVLITLAFPADVVRVRGAWFVHPASSEPGYVISHRIGRRLPNVYPNIIEADEVARQLTRYARNVRSFRQWRAMPKATRARIRAAVVRAGGGGP